PWTYRAYLANSLAEWSVAKDAYVRSASGWFSCRSACYLSLGVPVILQDTGFGCALPNGEGVIAFSTPDQARAAVEAVMTNPDLHARTAAAIAREYFDSGPVLTRLLETAM
ncbi:MAG: glycosyltransferase family 1 protein, partial [Candidatus Binataceae bacterium]